MKKIKAFIYKLPETIGKCVEFLFCSFIGIIINIGVVYGVLKFENNQYSLLELIKSNTILFSLHSSVAGISLGILLYYFDSIKKRKTLMIAIIVALILSIGISIITLLETIKAEFFLKSLILNGTSVSIIIIFIATLFFKYDETVALRDKAVQEEADKTKQLSETSINGKNIKI